MTTIRLAGFVAVALLAVSAAFAQEITVARNVLGPEGPLFVEGHLYFVGWASDTLSRLDGNKVTVLNHTAGCGHNGLAFTHRRTFLIACDDEHGAIIETDMAGRQLRRWDTDSRGRKLDGGINDIVVTKNDGAYATLSVRSSIRQKRLSAKSSICRRAVANGSRWRMISTMRTASPSHPIRKPST